MEGIPSSAGSVSQVKACAMQLLQLAKSSGVTVFLVGHVTKSGDIAGPKVLEHLGGLQQRALTPHVGLLTLCCDASQWTPCCTWRATAPTPTALCAPRRTDLVRRLR